MSKPKYFKIILECGHTEYVNLSVRCHICGHHKVAMEIEGVEK